MSGKATLLVVVGFSLIFLIVGRNLGNISNRAVDNSIEYYNQTLAHELAVSSANLAANKIFFDNSWDKGFSNLPLKNGFISAQVNLIDAFKNIKEITSTGSYNGFTHQVKITLAPSNFSKFAYYSVDESGIHWHDGDTVWGPWHSQDNIRVTGKPVFYGKVTTKGKVNYTNGPGIDNPQFYGGLETGVNISFPADDLSKLSSLASSDGRFFNDPNYKVAELVFEGDSIKYRFWKKTNDFTFPIGLLTSLLNPPTPFTTVHASAFANNGVLFVKDMNLRVRGNVKGQFTVASNKDIFIDDNIVYNSDPRTNPNSTDMLGIVTQTNVYVSDNAPNRKDIDLQASIYCKTGGFGAENPGGRPNSGELRLFGGVQQHKRLLVSNPWPQHGFSKRYTYDKRLMVASPPHYPGTGIFEIVSWQE